MWIDSYQRLTHESSAQNALKQDVYNTYGEWCDAEGIQALSKTKFRTGITLLGDAQRKRKGISRRTRYFVFQRTRKTVRVTTRGTAGAQLLSVHETPVTIE